MLLGRILLVVVVRVGHGGQAASPVGSARSMPLSARHPAAAPLRMIDSAVMSVSAAVAIEGDGLRAWLFVMSRSRRRHEVE